MPQGPASPATKLLITGWPGISKTTHVSRRAFAVANAVIAEADCCNGLSTEQAADTRASVKVRSKLARSLEMPAGLPWAGSDDGPASRHSHRAGR